MTRDELNEKVAVIIRGHDPDYDTSAETAQDILDTIFAALKEPTEEMMKTIGATSIQRLVWQAMLSASPLAPKEE